MVFSDLFFLFVFLPCFILLYNIGGWIDRRRCALEAELPHFPSGPGEEFHSHAWRNAVLVVFSLLFYAWGEPVYVLLMIVTVALNYGAALWMMRTRRWRKLALWVGLLANILILCSFKYLGFICTTLAQLGADVPVPEIALPIGISFYIFQSVSYLIDVYRSEAPPQRRYADLLLYISMFPQLIAGPIVRYDTIAREINSRKVSAEDMADGAFRFLIGLGKKVILANQFSEISDRFLADGLTSLSTGGAWVGVIAFTFQIYFDFSGYSDMAIGIGRCLGFHFKENFNHPYCCNSITDFWRRWHISLGSFFRDYVYIPMGGNRRHQWFNILLVWFLTGMWHGASWNFIIWGLYFGLIIAVEKFTIIPWHDRIPRVMLHMYALVIVVLGWGIFYFDDLGALSTFFRAIVGVTPHETDFTVEGAIFDNFWLWITAIFFCMPVRSYVSRLPDKIFTEDGFMSATVTTTSRIVVGAVLLVVSVALLIGATNNAFLYTRF